MHSLVSVSRTRYAEKFKSDLLRILHESTVLQIALSVCNMYYQ